MNEIFVSCVGYQPGAIAAAVKTRVHQTKSAVRVLLLATAATQTSAGSLREWIEKSKLGAVEVKLVSTVFDDGDEPPSAGAAMREYIEQLEQRLPVLFFADPGQKMMVLSVMAALSELGGRFLRVHADIRDLYLFDGKSGDALQKLPLRDIGWDALPSLYSLKINHKPMLAERQSLPRAINMVIDETGVGETFKRLAKPDGVGWLIANERRGRLYCLVGPPPRDQTKAGAAAVARSVMHIKQQFGSLRPRLTVYASGAVRTHLEMEGVACIDAAGRQRYAAADHLRQWFHGTVSNPASTVVADQKSNLPGVPALGTEEEVAASNSDVLVEVLGLDVSANLISMATHQKQRGLEHAVVLCDLATPQIMKHAQWLRQELPALGYKTAKFIPIDVLGRTIPKKLDPEAERWEGVKFHVDVTPGTKAQACQLMSTLSRNAELWSVDGALGKARMLGRGKAISLAGPPILSWARSAGGPLQSEGGAIQQPKKFYKALLPLLGERIANDADSLRDWKKAAVAEETARGNARLSSYRGALSVAAEDGKWIKQKPRENDGALFEHLTAAAFCSIEEPPDEIRLNIAWAWTEEYRDYLSKQHGLKKGQVMRCELDVVVRFSHQIFCVSCKSYDAGSYAQKEIETVARNGFGRFAIPVLACFHFENPAEKKKSWKARQGAVLIDRKELGSPRKLREALDLVVASRTATT